MNYLLYPFTLIYSWITSFRNRQYDLGFLSSTEFDLPVICIGNLSMGGSGKTPIVEYLIDFFLQHVSPESLCILSRGYKRKSKGFFLLDKNNPNPFESGDESSMIKHKYSEINVAVCEDRALAIPIILTEKEKTKLIILDDSFQHRRVRAGLNILLTDYTKPFFYDYPIPSGRLRESRFGAKRADIIIVTKSPPNYEREKYTDLIHRYSQKETPVFFTGIKYGDLVHFDGPEIFPHKETPVFSVCGIANPNPFQEQISSLFRLTKKFHFPDHYSYANKDLTKIFKEISRDKNNSELSCLITTTKDAIKIAYLTNKEGFPGYPKIPMYYLPVKHFFYDEVKDKNYFHNLLVDFINKFYRL